MEKPMDTILTALKDTPIPTILVIAGIAFLLLSIAGQLAGRIAVPPERQRQATIIGCLLVVVGVALHVVPPLLNPPAPSGVSAPTPSKPPQKKEEPTPQPTPTPPSPQPPPPTPQPTTPEFKVVPLPSLDARLTALRFFEANPCDMPPLGQRTYRQRFVRKFAREIFTELTLEHPKHERRRDFPIHAFYRHKERLIELIGSPVLEAYIRTDQESSVYSFDKDQGNPVPRLKPCSGDQWWGDQWLVGSYTVDVYINREPVTSASFEIYE
jgi:hypothetical protein